MRVLFMGTPDFAVSPLRAIHESTHELVAVMTQPDRPAGRRHRLQPSPVKIYAEESGLQLLQPERASAKASVRQLKSLEPDVICVVAYGQILRKAVLDLPAHGCLNVHPSLLPRYRGAAPIQRAIIDGAAVTGVTIMLLDEGEDTGDIVVQRETEILPDDTSVTLAEKLSQMSGPLLLEAIELAVDGPPPHTAQNHALATHAPKLAKQEATLEWARTAEILHNHIRGMQPWPGAMTQLPDGTGLKVISSCPGPYPGSASGKPGTLYVTAERTLWVETGSGGIQLLLVQPANKRAMPASDFINGYQITTGMQLMSPD